MVTYLSVYMHVHRCITYAHVYVCMHVCMYVCMSVCTYACNHVCIYVAMYIGVHVYIYLYTFVSVYVYMCVCMCMCMWTCMCMYMYMCRCMYMCICVCVYVYVYVYSSLCRALRVILQFQFYNRVLGYGVQDMPKFCLLTPPSETQNNAGPSNEKLFSLAQRFSQQLWWLPSSVAPNLSAGFSNIFTRRRQFLGHSLSCVENRGRQASCKPEATP